MAPSLLTANELRMLKGEDAPLSEDNEAKAQNDNNNGRTLDGPWAFGSSNALTGMQLLLGY